MPPLLMKGYPTPDIQSLRVPKERGPMSDMLKTQWPHCREMDGSGKVTFSRGQSPVGERIFDVPWCRPDSSTWLDFVIALLGNVELDNTGKPVRTPPDVFSNEMNWLICHECSIDGMYVGGTEAGNVAEGAQAWPVPATLPKPHPMFNRIIYKRAKIRAKYAAREYAETVEINGQSLSRPGSSYAFTSPPNEPNEYDPSLNANATYILDEPVGIIFPMMEYAVEVRQVLAPDFFALMDLIGKVNGNAMNCKILRDGREITLPIDFDANGNPQNPTRLLKSGDLITQDVRPLAKFFGRDIATLMFLGGTGRRTYLPSGARAWDLSCRFQYNPRGFNRVFRGATGKFEHIKSIGDNGPLYEPWDFSLIESYLNYYS